MILEMEPLTRERRRQMTRHALVNAAARLFAERGFAGASLDDIAAAAGFTRGAIYSNFPAGKDDLMLGVADHLVAEQERIMFEAVSQVPDDPGAAIELAVELWQRIATEHRDFVRLQLEVRLHALRNPAFRERLAALEAEQAERQIQTQQVLLDAQGRDSSVPLWEFTILARAANEGLHQLAAIDAGNLDRYVRVVRLMFQLEDSLMEPRER